MKGLCLSIRVSEADQTGEISTHWIEDVVQRVLDRNVDRYVISSGKSPSGSIHIGIMRELIICDVIRRRLRALGKQAVTLFVVDDLDPLRSLPPDVPLRLDEWAGIPYCDVPDPFGCCESFGRHWTNELVATFPDFGIRPRVIWTSELYRNRRMLREVRTCLRNTEVIREIMIEYVARDFDSEQRAEYVRSMQDWYPVSVICPKCNHIQSGVKGSIQPNRVSSYDPETDMVSYECSHCGHSDTGPLGALRVKLGWRVDWPAKWHLLNVTCEPAGKDHAVKGGSYDTGLEISRRVFGWQGPVKVPYEWVQIGGRDMATSEGIVFTPKAWLEIAPPQVYRYLMLKTDLQRTVNIQPELIPDLVDRYDHLEMVYYGLESSDADMTNIVRIIYPLSEVGPVRKRIVPKLSFKFALLMSQLENIIGHDLMLQRSMESIKKRYGVRRLSRTAQALVLSRLSQALRWVQQYGSERDLVRVTESVPDDVLSSLSDVDVKFLSVLADSLRTPGLSDGEIQSLVFQAARSVGVPERRGFAVIYMVLISRNSGPRIGPFINMLGTDWVLKRLEQVILARGGGRATTN
ncbi:MAG: lysine--tRNA ligase [Candidatus Thorarchaeota archaeon]